MKIIILEGIATSGKTSVKNTLRRLLKKMRIEATFIHEDIVLDSIFKKLDQKKSILNLQSLLEKHTRSKSKVLVLDRFHLTYLPDKPAEFKKFNKLFKILKRQDTLTCLLKIPENKIVTRIAKAISHRNKGWITYVKTKGKNLKEITKYYRAGQRNLLKSVRALPLPYKIFDTADMNFKKVALELCEFVQQ